MRTLEKHVIPKSTLSSFVLRRDRSANEWNVLFTWFFSLFGLITKYFTLMTLNYKNFEMTTPPPHYPVDFPFVWQGPVPKSILSSDTANLGNLTPMGTN